MTSSTGWTNAYQYDPLDYRIGRTGGTLGSRDYYLEGEHLEAEYSGGVLQSKYFRGISTDELVAGFSLQSGKMVPSIYHHDQVMSVGALSSHDGQVQATVRYGAFGNVLGSSGSTANRLWYTGREQDADTQLYYYRARYYDPSVGRFISEDPKGFGAGVNFYAYVGNNPVNGNDPSGQWTIALKHDYDEETLGPALAAAMIAAAQSQRGQQILTQIVGGHEDPRKSEPAGHERFLRRRVSVASFAISASRLR